MNNVNHRAAAEMRRRQGMQAVIDEYQTPLLQYAAKLLNKRTLVQDVVQNTFIKLFRQWQPHTHVDQRLKSWLFREVHNQAVAIIRVGEHRRRSRGGHVTLGVPEGDGDLASEVVYAEEQVEIGGLGVLPAKDCQVVLLRIQQGMSYAEIGHVIGKSIGYVGDLLHKAVHQLSGLIEEREGVRNESLRMER